MNRGIFENFPNQPRPAQDAPFAMVPEASAEAEAVVASPFSAMAKEDSPFSAGDEAAEVRSGALDRPGKLPERWKADSPFQMAEPPEGFGFEATPAVPSPVAVTETQRAPMNPTQAAIAAFSTWQEPVPHEPAAGPAPAFMEPAVRAFSAPASHVPAAFSPAPQAVPALARSAAASAPQAPTTSESPAEWQSDSCNIRQLELRAIFGVDREMNADEILQRSRALPGIRNLARVGPADIAKIEALKTLLSSLGFGNGALKIHTGAVPLEFIREGPVMLAVQTDGAFAPGVRETLIIVARELGRSG